ncbi:MAG TPA: ADP-ribosylglycohydrolase family protein [Chloroflexota bacterium]|nr:ADP-ribosylglycohydrolase family protein [Chloroflexota bacterium]
MLGQLAGDALGSMVEFEGPASIRARYPDGLRVIGPSPTFHTIAGQPTDDSELALALARSLEARHGYDEDDVAAAYARWIESDPFDCGTTIGPATQAMARAVGTGKSPAAAGREAANPRSESNGALMRQSPLAIWGAHLPPEELGRIVRADTTLTHPNRVCQDASAAYIVALAAAIRDGLSAEETYDVALAWDREHGASPKVTAALRDARAHLPEYTISIGHVIIALQNAFYQALHAPSLEEGVVRTVMEGGDTDTNGAIAGALLGGIHGVAAIPAQWREAVLHCRPERGAPGVQRPRPEDYWPGDALDLAEKLVDSRA